MAADLQEAGAAPFLVHLPRRVRRVPVDGLEMIGDVAKGEVLQLSAQPPDRALHGHGLVHVAAGPLGGAAIVEAKLIVGIPVGAPDPPAQMPGDARNAEGGMSRLCGHERLDLGGELGRDALVGVQRENPVVARNRRGVVLLRDIPRPVANDHAVSEPPGDGDGLVAAFRVDDHQFVGPGHRLERGCRCRRLRFGDDRDRELRHRGSLAEGFGIRDLVRILAPPMTRDELLTLFRRSGALLDGHFRLSSGLHSTGYLQCALVLQHPGSRGSARPGDRGPDARPGATVVLSPALGGVVIGQEVGRALGVRAMFAERQDGALALRRGFALVA